MSDTAQTVPIFGFGFGAKSPNVSAQQRTNFYVEKLDDPDKTALALYKRPGLSLFVDVDPGTGQSGKIRGLVSDALGSGFELLLFVQRDQLSTVDANGLVTGGGVGVIQTTSGVIRAAQLSDRGIFIDGVSGYLFTVASPPGAFDLASFPQAASFPFTTHSITSCASRIIAVDPSETGRFRWSNAGDAETWDALDFATAESSPDPLSAVFEMGGTLLLFGTQTIEFWSPAAAGAAGQLPFVRVGGANIQWGTTAIDTIKKCNDSVIFLGRNQGGNRQVIQLKGYDARPVSTPDIEYLISQETDAVLDAATSLFTVITGHPFYILNLVNYSLVYDISNGTWAKWITSGLRFGGEFAMPAFNKILVTDKTVGNIYVLNPDQTNDNGASITCALTSKHAWANLSRMSLRELRIDCQTGNGNPTNLGLKWSTDGGNNFGTTVNQNMGAAGTLTTMVWRNLGRARDWVFQLTSTIDAPVIIIGAAAIFS